MATTGDPWPFGIRCFKFDEVMLGRGEALRRSIEGDDTWMTFGVRMVNPDRHARIRAKHFHHAHRMQTERCQTYLFEAAFEYEVFKGGDDWDAAWASEENRRDSSVAAFENCAWGVS